MGKPMGLANGFFAVGQGAVGVIAIGQFACGFLAIGQFACGIVCVGQFAAGIVPIGLMGSLGIGWAAPVGVAAWGKGAVLKLAPVLTAPRVEPHAISLADVMAGKSGWLPVTVNETGRLSPEESDAHVLKAPRRLLATAALKARMGEIDRAFVHAFRVGNVLACDKMIFMPTAAQQRAGFYARSIIKFALLVGLCILFREVCWPLLEKNALPFL